MDITQWTLHNGHYTMDITQWTWTQWTLITQWTQMDWRM